MSNVVRCDEWDNVPARLAAALGIFEDDSDGKGHHYVLSLLMALGGFNLYRGVKRVLDTRMLRRCARGAQGISISIIHSSENMIAKMV